MRNAQTVPKTMENSDIPHAAQEAPVEEYKSMTFDEWWLYLESLWAKHYKS